MKRALLALWGLWCLSIAAIAWPSGSQAYASGTADGGLLAAVIWGMCAVCWVAGCCYLAAAAFWRRS